MVAGDPTQQLSDSIQFPTKHARSNRKIQDWELKIHKPIVIIGDSNLARIPHFRNPSIQIDSFPGANCLHIARVLQKLSPNENTQKVILSVGLNNREQLFQQTAKKQLQEMWRAATIACPNATIYTPIIHFSDRLPLSQQKTLKLLNAFICDVAKFLNDLSRLRFRVEPRDPIHWTKQTATDILAYWLDQLIF